MNEFVFEYVLEPAAVIPRFTTNLGQFVLTIEDKLVYLRAWDDDNAKEGLRKAADVLAKALEQSLTAQMKKSCSIKYASTVTSPTSTQTRNIEVGVSMPATLRISVGTLEIEIRDASGNIIDSAELRRQAKEQEQQRRVVSTAIAAAADPVLQRMLHHKARYVADTDGRLSALYDILEAAETEYVTRKAASSALGVPFKELDQLGKIANDPTIVNGRHPGQYKGDYRVASPSEVELCERVADAIIAARANFST
jgi:hypothetical protein